MATAFYTTVRSAEKFTKTGRATGEYIPEGTKLECDWMWTTGDLKGMRKIVSGDYVGYFVLDVDLKLFSDDGGGTPPTGDTLTIKPGKLQIEAEAADGTLKHFQNESDITLPESYG